MIDKRKMQNYTGIKFYNGASAWGSGAPWIVVLSERSDGKSLWYVKECIIDFWRNGHKLAYVRRHDNEIKQKDVNLYFADKNLTTWLNKAGYSGIRCIFSEIWLMRYNEDTGKEEKAELLGYPFCVNVQESKKSLHFDCYNFIFEEFITNKQYLFNEFVEFNHVISTACRTGKFRAILLGNTIARDCPYLREMGIDLFTTKPGKMYETELKQGNGNKIKAVFDYVEPKEKDTFFFGKSERSIVKGEFDADAQPHLFFTLDQAEILSKCIMVTGIRQAYHVKRLLYQDEQYLYIYPMKYDDVQYSFDDIFTTVPDFEHKYFYHAEKKRHRRYMPLIRSERMLFSDNLTGTEFKKAIRKHNPFST